MVAIALSFGICVMLVVSFDRQADTHAKVTVFGYFTLLMLLLQSDDFLIAVCMLVECLTIKRAEIKYYIVTSSQIKHSPWPLHLGSRKFHYKMEVYEYEGKKQEYYGQMLW